MSSAGHGLSVDMVVANKMHRAHQADLTEESLAPSRGFRDFYRWYIV